MKTTLKFLALTLGATALVMGCATTPADGKVYKFKYNAEVATFRTVNYVTINDEPGNTYVEFMAPNGMEYCARGKIQAKKEFVGEYLRFIYLNNNKPDCPSKAVLIRNDGTEMFLEFNINNAWVVSKSKYTPN